MDLMEIVNDICMQFPVPTLLQLVTVAISHKPFIYIGVKKSELQPNSSGLLP